MMKTARVATLLAALACAATAASPGGALDELARRAANAAEAGATVVRGEGGWLFFAPELRSLSVGKFWGPEASTVSRAANPEFADPLPAILDFHAQLQAAGIELIFVPVPAKAAIYVDALVSSSVAGAANSKPQDQRIDVHHRAFYGLLRERGVRVLDLVPAFLAHRATSDIPLYCRQDTHWAGQGIEIAAGEIAQVVRDGGWVTDVQTRAVERVGSRVRITGDLWVGLGDPELAKEELRLITIRRTPADDEAGGPVGATNDWRNSPVLLLGDSHCLVFHAGADMHARGAGLPDHLAAELGFPPDVVAVRGSGATPSRLALLRRRDNLAGKRVVIWCMSVREFTESQGWRKVPVIR